MQACDTVLEHHRQGVWRSVSALDEHLHSFTVYNPCKGASFSLIELYSNHLLTGLTRIDMLKNDNGFTSSNRKSHIPYFTAFPVIYPLVFNSSLNGMLLEWFDNILYQITNTRENLLLYSMKVLIVQYPTISKYRFLDGYRESLFGMNRRKNYAKRE